MKTFTANTKCCATCANWGGARKLMYNGATVDVSSPGDRGKCYAGTFCSVTAGPAAVISCPKYQKWAALK